METVNNFIGTKTCTLQVDNDDRKLLLNVYNTSSKLQAPSSPKK